MHRQGNGQACGKEMAWMLIEGRNQGRVGWVGLTWPLLGRMGLAECGSATASQADDGLADEGLKSWRVAREEGRGWGASWGRWQCALGE